MKKFISSILIIVQVLGISVFTIEADELLEADDAQDVKIIENGGILTVDTGEYYQLDTDGIYLLGEDKYNSDIDNLEYISPPKSQGSYGVCWSFAGISALETAAMMADGQPSGDYDFSEAHAAVASSNSCPDENNSGFTRDFDDGGNDGHIISYVTRDTDEGRYNGNVEDDDYPYSMMDDDNRSSEDNMNKDVLDYFPQTYISVDFGDTALSDDERLAQVAKIKEIVKEYGSAVVYIYCGESSDNANKGFFTASDGDKVFYYNNQSQTSNHAVCIVGYDDTYSADNFSDFSEYLESGDSLYSAVPESDGAFIVKNSWGEDWGNNGYFYMSYETAIQNMSACGDVISRSSFDNIYETSHYVSDSATRYNRDTYSAGAVGNVFTANGKNEEVKYIGISVKTQGTCVKFYVNPDADENKFNSDELVEVKVKTDLEYTDNGYYVDEPGYRVFELEEPVTITGSKFTIAADLYDGNVGYLIPLEKSIDDWVNVTAQEGIGYRYSSVSGLKDIEAGKYTNTLSELDVGSSGINIPIKAYTTGITVTVDGNEVSLEDGKIPSEYSQQKLYTLDGTSYYPFDAQTEITDDIELFTLSYIAAPDISMNVYQHDSENSKLRFVGEIGNDYEYDVDALGFRYSYDDGASYETEQIEQLYESLQGGYTPSDAYAFISAQKDIKNYTVSAFAVFDGKYIYSEEKTITVE